MDRRDMPPQRGGVRSAAIKATLVCASAAIPNYYLVDHSIWSTVLGAAVVWSIIVAMDIRRHS
jgi:hypothetical protein